MAAAAQRPGSAFVIARRLEHANGSTLACVQVIKRMDGPQHGRSAERESALKRAPAKQVGRTFARCKPIFFALGDDTRQQIIVLLTKAESLNVTQLAKRLPLSRPAISHHLGVLRRAGLVGAMRQGTENYYFLTADEAFALLKQFVFEVEKHGD